MEGSENSSEVVGMTDLDRLVQASLTQSASFTALLVIWAIPLLATVARMILHLVRGVEVQKVTLTIFALLVVGFVGVATSFVIGERHWDLRVESELALCDALAKIVAGSYILTHFLRYQFLSQRMVASVIVLRNNASSPSRDKFWYWLSISVQLTSSVSLVGAVLATIYFGGRITMAIDGRVEYAQLIPNGLDFNQTASSSQPGICVIVAPGVESFAMFFGFDVVISILFTFLFAYPLYRTANLQARILAHPSEFESRMESNIVTIQEVSSRISIQDGSDKQKNSLSNNTDDSDLLETWATTAQSQQRQEDRAQMIISKLKVVAQRHLLGAFIGLFATTFALVYYAFQFVRVTTETDMEHGFETLLLSRAHAVAFVDLAINMLIIVFLTTAWIPKARFVLEPANVPSVGGEYKSSSTSDDEEDPYGSK